MVILKPTSFFVSFIVYPGTVGVQIAKALGAYVVGVCSTDNVELVKKLGADEVVDYKKEDVTEKYTNQDFDLIFDTVGSAAEVKPLTLLFYCSFRRSLTNTLLNDRVL